MAPRPSTARSLDAEPHGELAGRITLITGAGRGIGHAIAVRLAAAGANVVVGFRTDAAAAKATVAQIRAAGGDAVPIQLDVTDPAQTEQVLSQINDQFGRLDVLINNAGILPRASFLEIGLDEWDRVLRTNLTGSFLVSQHAARIMAVHRSGSIVHVSSTNEQVASEQCTAYAVSKGGLRMLTRQMALELGPLGIRTNSVAPGMVETDLNAALRANPGSRRAALTRIPRGRFTTAAEVAETVCFLASDRAAAVTGTTVFVDGGRLAA